MKIRKALPQDIPYMLEHAKEFIKFYNNKNINYNQSHLIHLAQTLMDSHVLVVAETEEGEVAGMLGAMYVPNHIDPSCISLTELFWWVGEEHRRTRAGWLLLSFLEAVGEKYEVPVVISVLPQTGDVTPLLERHGFVKVEESYVK